MADSVREQKLAAARKKLRQFQKKKGTKRVIEGSSKEGTPEVEGRVTEDSSPVSDSGTLSSHASSVDLASEEFIEISEDSPSKVDSTVLCHDQSHPQDLTNGESEIHSTVVTTQVCIADGHDTELQNEYQYPTGLVEGELGEPSSPCATINATHVTTGLAGELEGEPSFPCATINATQVTTGLAGELEEEPSSPCATINATQVTTGLAGELEGEPSSPCATINATQVTPGSLEVSQVSSSSEVDGLFNAVNTTVPVDSPQAHTADYEENNHQNGLVSSFQPPAIENEISNHDSFELLTQSGSDITSISTDLPQNVPTSLQNEDVTSTTFNQLSDPDSQTECTAAFHQIIPSVPVMTDLPEEVAVMTDQPEEVAVMTDLPEEVAVMTDLPEEPESDVLPNDFIIHEEQNSSDLYEREGSVSSETTASITTAIHVSTGEGHGEPVLKSSSESLRQISLQLSGLMSENEGSVPALPDSTIYELERRNAELAALLQQESQTSQQQSQHITQLLALEVLEWGLEEATVVREGRLFCLAPDFNNWTRRGRSLKMASVHVLLVTHGSPRAVFEDEVPEDGLVTPRNLGIKDVAMLAFKDHKVSKTALIRHEPWLLSRCVVAWESEGETECFEVTDLNSKDTYIFKGSDSTSTEAWFRYIQFHALSVGLWKRRRPALANIMINGMNRS